MKEKLKVILPIFIIILFCIPVVLPYFKSGYFPTHDGEWAVVRLADMFRSLRDLQFPVRYSGALNFGYGYPLFNFAYPFPYYLGIFFYFPIHSFVISIKSLFVMSVFLSGIFMYFASYGLWKDKFSGLVSAIIYIYLPYRMVDLYVRGSIGESLSLALFPLIFYLSQKLFNTNKGGLIVLFLSIAIAMLVMTHNIMTVLFLPVLIIFMTFRFIYERRKDTAFNFFISLFLGACLSAFFWAPALFEKSNILLSKIPIADRNLHFVSIDKLFIPSWGYGVPSGSGGFSYQLGIAQIIVVIFVFIIFIVRAIKQRLVLPSSVKYAGALLVIYCLCILMMFPFTSSIWKAVPLISEINYPWTLLAVIGFLTALLSGFLAFQNKFIKYSLFLILLVAVVNVYPYAKPASYSNNSDEYYMTNEATTTSSTELMPLWVKEFPNVRYKDKVEVVRGTADIKNVSIKSNKITFDYFAKSEDVKLRINTIYYPGWQMYINNYLVPFDYSNKLGVMEFEPYEIQGKVYLGFTETFPRILADLASLVAVFALLFILILSIFPYNYEKK